MLRTTSCTEREECEASLEFNGRQETTGWNLAKAAPASYPTLQVDLQVDCQRHFRVHSSIAS